MDNATYVNKLVSYTSIASGVVKGKILGTMTDRYGTFFRVKVTTGDVKAYAKGSEFFVSVENFGKFLILR